MVEIRIGRSVKKERCRNRSESIIGEYQGVHPHAVACRVISFHANHDPGSRDAGTIYLMAGVEWEKSMHDIICTFDEGVSKYSTFAAV